MDFYVPKTVDPTGKVIVNDANPEPEKLALIGMTRVQYEQNFKMAYNWSEFRHYLKVSGFMFKVMVPEISAVLGAYLTDALRQEDYDDLTVAVNGIHYGEVTVMEGVRDLVDFTAEEMATMNDQAQNTYYLPGPIFL